MTPRRHPRITTMTMTTKIILAAMLLVGSTPGEHRAQFTKEYNPWPVVAGDTLELPFWGGINDPKPSLEDFDGDGLVDLFLGEIKGKLGYLRNTGTPTAPVWTPVTERLGGLDVGTWHTFCDIDADGDLDLFGDSRDGLTHYWRNDSGGDIVFTLMDTAFGGFETGQNNTCDFADIDADGDWDFFFGNLSGTVSLWRNIGDSAHPVFVFETNYYDSIIAFPGGLATDTRGHGFSTLRFADIDTDNDLDLFYGDIFNFSMYYFRNDGTADTSALGRITEEYLPAPTLGFNHAAFADLDNDLDLDLLVGAANGQNLGNLLLCRNVGNPFQDSFVVETADLLTNIDVGSFSVPAFGDLDGDHDWDLLIGGGDGRLTHYENTGTSQSPRFERTTAFFHGIDVGLSAAPELVDWDADGDLDLFIGTESGAVEFWRNDGSATSFAPVKVTGNFGGIQVDRLAVPRIADMNGDDTLDVIVGEWDFNGFANVRLYRNIGSQSAPIIVLVDASLLTRVFREFALPVVEDWDGDGAKDLIVGGRFLDLTWYRNTAAPGSYPDSLTLIARADTIPGFDAGYRLALARVDIDSDGDRDVFVGEEDGGINFFSRDGGTSFLRGDVNVTGVVNSADIIYMVNFVFKGGPEPQPVLPAGDVNCSATITSSDIIYLVNFVFKGGPPPCLQ